MKADTYPYKVSFLIIEAVNLGEVDDDEAADYADYLMDGGCIYADANKMYSITPLGEAAMVGPR